MKRKVYLDYAAATPLDPRVRKGMLPYLEGYYGNASSIHSFGREVSNVIRNARTDVASILNADISEVIFTGSGSESDTLAIMGIARKYKHLGKHVVMSSIEHKAVLEAGHALEREGFQVSYIGVAKNGIVDPENIRKALRKDTILVSVMYANNEIGTIQPIKEISKIVRSVRNNGIIPIFHTDACQAPGALPLDVKKLGVDALSLNGSKMYGPKGIGILYLREGVDIEAVIPGGEQERGRRAGTESVALIVGIARAFRYAEKDRIKESKRLSILRDYFIQEIKRKITGVMLNGHATKRLPNNINMIFEGIEGESLVLMLDQEGIAASTGSACNSFDLKPSHVLMELNIPEDMAHGSLRMTLGRLTTKTDINYVLKKLPGIISRLRELSTITYGKK